MSLGAKCADAPVEDQGPAAHGSSEARPKDRECGTLLKSLLAEPKCA
ncbi:hypothetical protein AA0112_g2276 [Alternaria arborescens]|nr:hypothetical protein AA0111_g1189 [Alternaria arborescens]RYN41454.1 hypothetical protein AA0112_g2276 [Alternaria arborescens]RYO40969.1 hypothetical protein AA0111_g1189 [Alternaria arborescens]